MPPLAYLQSRNQYAPDAERQYIRLILRESQSDSMGDWPHVLDETDRSIWSARIAIGTVTNGC